MRAARGSLPSKLHINEARAWAHAIHARSPRATCRPQHAVHLRSCSIGCPAPRSPCVAVHQIHLPCADQSGTIGPKELQSGLVALGIEAAEPKTLRALSRRLFDLLDEECVPIAATLRPMDERHALALCILVLEYTACALATV